MSKFFWIGSFLALSLGLGMICWAQPKPGGGDLRDFMRVKLKHSQDILAGLVTEDLEKVAKGAQELSLLSQSESWQVYQTEGYLQHSKEFRRAADALRDAAKAKNIDAVALAYVDTTLKCVTCHKYVRDVRMAELPK
jgi:cytochrome c556